MTSVDPPIMGAAAETASPFAVEQPAESKWDAFFDAASERLNPILVKEARQALKSRQFVITFSLLLIFCWGWSVLGVALMSPEIEWSPRGHWMLVGYIWILNFPLTIIVPFSAFRSLSSELEDGTYELLSISTLSPRQIIAGKLGSAFLQMLVHLSALAPCIAFTYLLSGVDIVFIGLLLWYLFFASLMLSLLGLLLATLTDVRGWQIVLSVVLILALAGVFFFGSMMITALLLERPPIPYDDPNFWLGNAAAITVCLCVFALLFFSAAARITFASENRATPLRICIFVTQAVVIGWLGLMFLRVNEDEALYAVLTIMSIFWGVFGMFLVGEWPELSERVKRSLPANELGRMLLTWFNPGPGTGFMFTMSNMLACTLICWIGVWYADYNSLGAAPRDFNWFWFSVLAVCYLTIYIGLGRLIIAGLRNWFQCDMFAGFLIQLIVMLFGLLAPIVVQFTLIDDDYTPLQLPNFVWTLAEVADDGLRDVSVAVPMMLIPLALFIFAVNVIASWREVRQSRLAAPQRVLEDDAALKEKPREKQSPWDDEE